MSNIKRAFVSRFTDGLLVEVDYSQLEVCVLAHLSKDEQLLNDLKNGVDIHSENARDLFGMHFTPHQRRLAKGMSFQLQYGASAKRIAKEFDISVAIAEAFIEMYYRKYPGVKRYQENFALQVKRNRVPSTYRTKSGTPAGISKVQSETGRIYTFVEYDGFHGSTSFSPTQMKNYETQGTATGDIVPMMIGILAREIFSDPVLRNKVLLVNTVHDSVILDVTKDMLTECVSLCYNVLTKAKEEYEHNFGYVFSLPLDIEVKVGPNWADMKKYIVVKD